MGCDKKATYDIQHIALVASYDKSGLSEFDGNAILAFKLGSACIYFEEKKKLVVFDMNKTQNMFPFLEHYKNLARTLQKSC